MRSTLLIGCLLWGVVFVHSLTRVERPASVQKRAASPQLYQGQPNSTYSAGNQYNQTRFQWVKVNNQWVRSDGTKLPGYSQANVPYNQSASQWNTPTPSRGSASTQPNANAWNTPQRPGNQSATGGGWGQRPAQPSPQQPQRQPSQSLPPRQNSTAQGGLGWNPDADRALTQDLPPTTPRPVHTTTPRPVLPQTPPTAYRPPAPTQPIRGPFGSGYGPQQKPPGGHSAWNPDASLTYGFGARNTAPERTKPPTGTNTGPPGSNPWGGLFNRLT